ncbi:L,D-transpeptidase [Actinospica durhamensis]|uniref:L,D-transpeptidase n=1 Tax=Actinospica durhamensis TaxID=1508375 RepID=A0A941INA1_9ACTN|nr:L,D-transpeptidase [Actinospica durhamensis]MBR7831792.1 L,D-transpeptidase [Actinospica durhamensis]
MRTKSWVSLLVASVVTTCGIGAVPAQAAVAHAASARARCPESRAREVCVDLSHQRLWVRQDGRTIFGPVPIRSGRAGHATPDGWFSIQWRDYAHWSASYDSPMPFSQFFYGGDAIHGVYDDVHEGSGSYGCVNVPFDDARRLWGLLRVGDPVYVSGRRHGT